MVSYAFTDHYTRCTHVIPASTPKEHEFSVRKDLSVPLQLSVHDYHVLDAEKTGFTVILTHGTSFNKYFWQLITDYLLSWPEVKSKIKRLIAIDAANHGDSAVRNRSALPLAACWPDDSRDILHTLKHFQVQQPVIGIGHSFGGGAMCHAAMMEPYTFAATIFIEPILFQMKASTEALARLTLKRRDSWNSKDDLAAAFAKSPSFQDWDRKQLQVYIEHGTFALEPDNPFSRRVLKTPKEQESATYLAAPYPEILELLRLSRGRHHFIWGSNSKVISAQDRKLVEQIIHFPSTSQVMPGVGHLIPMTHPKDLSVILAGILRDIPVLRSQIKL